MEFPAGTVLLDENFGTTVVNATEISNAEVFRAVEQQDRSLFATFRSWAENLHPLLAYEESTTDRRAGNLWHRDRYLSPVKFFDQMRLAQNAVVEDDIVAGVAETTESLAFSSVSFFADDPDEQDIYNQVARKIDLDSRLREIWRELFVCSQCYIAVTRSAQTLKVRGTTKEGNQRRREFRIVAPKRMVLLDPTKVIPVGSVYGNAFTDEEPLAYIATRAESLAFEKVNVGESSDDIVKEIIVGRYVPNKAESVELGALGVDVTNLWLLDPKKVFRHSVTRPGYRRVADIRMKSVNELLDMKHQLRQMERAHLIGATNFIILVTKGTDQHPALPAEVINLQAQVRTVARVPILVGDHRLHVEIVTPKLDNTLRAERWNTIDSRISARLYGMFMLGNYAAGAGGDDSIKLVKVIARGMETRRHMIRRVLEKHVFDPLFNGNESLTTRPKLQFHPRSIALDFDAAYASFLFDLRQARELSRETILNQFELDQDLEAEYLTREHEEYDDIFKTQVPFSTPNPANQQNPALPPGQQRAAPPGQVPPEQSPALRRDNGGGRRNGGGAAPGTGQGQEPRRRTGRPAPGAPQARELTIKIEGVDGAEDLQTLKALIDRAVNAEDSDGGNTDAD